MSAVAPITLVSDNNIRERRSRKRVEEQELSCERALALLNYIGAGRDMNDEAVPQ
jgi:hypothetical protein